MQPNREVELKLAIDPGEVARLLASPILAAAAIGPEEVRELRTVYFDDREFSLAAHGISLRLRRAADRQWQTVKLEEDAGAAGLFARSEHEVEVPGERPDLGAVAEEAVRARLLEVLDGRPLEPVFETVMRRTHRVLRDDVAEWSLDLDEGEIRSGFASEPICEVELELRSGPMSHLFEVALALCDEVALRPGTRSKSERGHALHTGLRPSAARARPVLLAPDATLKQAIVPIARSCLAQIGDNVEVALEGADPEGVHQMRVGVRRMRSLVSLVRRGVPSVRLGRLRGPLRGLGALLGEVRDLDVFLDQTLAPHLARLGEDPGLEGLRAGAIALREERRRALREGLLSPRTARLLLELGHWIATLEEQDLGSGDPSVALARPADRFAESALTRLLRKVRKQVPAALEGSAVDRHALRITLKKLRYASEFFRSLFDPKDAKRFLRRLEALQDGLGLQNDAETGRQLLQHVLDRASVETLPDLARGAGFVEGWSARALEKVPRKLAKQWARFEAVRPFWESA
ncbi:MAG: CHAD domain-containing protein [Myxococcota bacterium]